MTSKLDNFTDVFSDPDEIEDSQPLSFSPAQDTENLCNNVAKDVAASVNSFQNVNPANNSKPAKGTGQCGEFRSADEIDEKYRGVFSYPFFNLVQSRVIEDALYSDKSMVVCAPTGSGKTVVFEMAIVRLLMELEQKNENTDFKIIYMAPVKALCTERLTEWYSKFTKLGLLCIEVTGDTDVDFAQLNPYRIIITTPEKWDMLTRRWRDRRQLVEIIKLFLIDEVHILNDSARGPVLEAVVSRMKTIEASAQCTHRIEQLQHQHHGTEVATFVAPKIRFVAVSATVSNPDDVAAWLGTKDRPAVHYKFGDECRPVRLRRVVEGYPCSQGTSIFKFDIILNYKLWPIIQKYNNGKPTLIFCNTRKSVALTAETLSRDVTINFTPEQTTKLTALASTIKNKKLQSLIMSGVGCHHAGLLFDERNNIEKAFRNRDLPILITTTTLAMGVNLPAHLVIIKNTQHYVNGAYQEYSISTILQMVGRAGRPQFDTEATAVIMTRTADKARYQALVGGSEPLQSYLHKRLPENLNSEAALGTVSDVAQCVQWLQSTFLSVRAAKDPKRYLGLPPTAPQYQISKKIEELCVKAMNALASAGLITMDEACCIESTEAGRLMSIYYLDLETMKHILKINGTETVERMLWIVCESHELSDMHLRIDERRVLNALNRNNAARTIRYPMKGKINTRQMKLNCIIQAILGCLQISDPSLNQEAMKIMRIANRVCKCLVAYVTRPALTYQQPKFYSAVLNTIILGKCVEANLWENSPYVSKQLKGIGPAFSTLLASAGKVNFMLLEESHPRDLERIMNKGPPAGNMIRKQISLLPKYQLTMTSVDAKVVSVHLVLLNQNNLAENVELLTAGIHHKSYVIIGDSENTLLLLASFTDKDMLGMYDGSITYQITRKHGFEHTIFAHCISSTFAGIDTHCEYIFKDLEHHKCPPSSGFKEELVTKTLMKQTAITDSFKQRKRKNTEYEISEPQEKKKPQYTLYEKFKNLKESTEKTSPKEDFDKSGVDKMLEKKLHEISHLDTNITPQRKYEKNEPIESTLFEELDIYEINDDDIKDDDKINNILNEIECEISKEKQNEPDKSITNSSSSIQKPLQKPIMPKSISTSAALSVINPNIERNRTTNNCKKRSNKNIPKKSNYNFIELLDKNVDLSDEESVEKGQSSFSDTIRTRIEGYLQKAQENAKPQDTILTNHIYTGKTGTKSTEHVINTEQDSVIKNIDGDQLLSKPMNKDLLNLAESKKNINNIKNLQINSEIYLDKNKTANLDTELITAINIMPTESSNAPINYISVPSEPSNIKNVQSYNRHDDRVLHEIEKEQKNVDMTINQQSLYEIELPKCSQNVNTRMADNHSTCFRNKDTSVPDPTNNLLEHQDLRENNCNEEINNNIVSLSNIRQVSNTNLGISESPLSGTVNPTQMIVEQEPPENIPYTYNEANKKLSYGNQLHELGESTDRLYNNSNIPEVKVVRGPIATRNNSTQSGKITKHDKPMVYNFGKLEQHHNYNKLNTCPKSVFRYNSQQKSTSKGNPVIPMNMLPYKSTTQHTVIERLGRSSNTDNNVITAQDMPMESSFGNQLASNAHHFYTKLSLVSSSFQNQTPDINKILYTAPAIYGKEKHSRSLNIPKRENTSRDKPNNFIFDQSASVERYNFSTPETKEIKSDSARVTPELIEEKYNTFAGTLSNWPTFNQNKDDTHRNSNNQNLYVNKYSLTSNQVNVSTQETEDHVVRVIRKLRIDMDVTEIVCEEMKTKENKDSNNAMERLTNEKEHASNDILRTNTHASSIKCDESVKPVLVMRRSETDKTTEDKLPEELSTNTMDGIVSTKQFGSNINHTELANDRDDKMRTGYILRNRSDERKPNNVKSILQKYSNIMRNNYTNHSQSNIQIREETSGPAKKDKPKRPFKISDIHHLNTPLPETLINNPINVTECFNMLKQQDNTHLVQDEQINTQLFSTFHQTEQELNDWDAQKPVQIESVLEDFEEIPDYLEVNDSLTNIDQNMFDPKTLLQQFGNNEELIPPPPEFSDNFNETLCDTPSIDSYEPMSPDEVETRYETSEDMNNTSIFEDHSQVELTPSKEIETWNFSEEGANNASTLGPNPWCFTIMRNNRGAVRKDNLVKTSTKSKLDLTKFKYNNKNKFKRRL